MRTRVVLTLAYLLMLGVWILSFFVTALDLQGVIPGWRAAAISAVLLGTMERTQVLFHLYFGSFWLANLFVLASPWGLWRARRGRGGVYLGLFIIWDLLTLSYVIYDRVTTPQASTLRAGYWAWEASLVGMTIVLLLARRLRQS
jgi:hypothetical protein